eukprot:TRINITY_DN351_c0_g1_i10.p1 TRINITY_DN351_c0_g1~~TRINITY_DN351_c0_g1_i10.p1  ORF type:complete len:913 (-),score=392.31 TRINITY_DN351_c0_g1_i10:2361-5099(-)
MSDEGESLLAWLNEVHNGDPVESLQDLTDGVVLAQVMHSFHASIDPESLKQDVGDNAVLQANNIKLLLGQLEHCLPDAGDALSELIDPNRVAKDKNVDDIVHLIEVTLYLAIGSEDKGEAIKAILSLPDETQVTLQQVTQRVMAQYQGTLGQAQGSPRPGHGRQGSQDITDLNLTASPMSSDVISLRSELDRCKADLAAAHQHLADTEGQLKNLTLVNDELMEEKGELEAKVAAAAALEAENTKLKETVEELRSSKTENTHKNEDFQRMLEEAESHIEDLKTKIKDTEKELTEAKQLQDEVDILKNKLTQAAKAETQLAKYKKKLEDAASSSGQLREAEQRAEEYLQRNLDLEEQLSKSDIWKNKCEALKKELAQLENDKTESNKNLQRKEFELQKSEEEVKNLSEKLSLQESKIEELEARTAAGANDSLDTTADGTGGAGGMGLELVGQDIREKLARLERENRSLKAKAGGGNTDERIEMLEGELEDMSQAKAKFEQDYLAEHKSNMELEAKVEDLKAQLDKLEDANVSNNLKSQESSIVVERLAAKEKEARKLEQQVAELSKAKKELSEETADLTKKLERSEAGLKETQNELVNAKRDLSLLGQDKEDMLKDLQTQKDQELQDKLAEATSALQAQVDAAKEESQANAEKAQQYDTLAQQLEDTKTELKSAMNEVNTLLKAKDSAMEKFVASQDQVMELQKKITEQSTTIQFKEEALSKLEKQVEAAANNASVSGSEHNAIRDQVLELQEKNHKLELKAVESTSAYDALNLQHEDAKAQLKTVQTKMAQLAEEKSRLDSYLHSAKKMIQELQKKNEDMQKKESGRSDVQVQEAVASLKAQINEKEKEISFLKRMREESKESSRREERLIISAFYELGLELQRLKTQGSSRQPSAHQATSMLGKMRRTVNQK